MSAPSRADVRAARVEMRGVRETRQMPIAGFEIREVSSATGAPSLRFTGYASVTCADENDLAHTYEMEDWIGNYTEGMVRGCFAKTLREGADVAFLVNHGAGGGVTMARTKPGTLKLSEDSTGLHTEATLNPARSDVQILRAAIEDGALDEMSFAFRVQRQAWSYAEDNGVIDRRWIQEVDMHKGDVSAVNFGANDQTGGLVAIRNRVLGRPLAGRARPASRRAAAGVCNRCDGVGTVDLGAGAITCPLCKGDGLALDAAASAAEAAALFLPNHSTRARLALAKARSDVRTATPRHVTDPTQRARASSARADAILRRLGR